MTKCVKSYRNHELKVRLHSAWCRILNRIYLQDKIPPKRGLNNALRQLRRWTVKSPIFCYQNVRLGASQKHNTCDMGKLVFCGFFCMLKRYFHSCERKETVYSVLVLFAIYWFVNGLNNNYVRKCFVWTPWKHRLDLVRRVLITLFVQSYILIIVGEGFI